MGGQLQVQGQQLGLPGTPVQAIGPLSVPCSGVQFNEQITFTGPNITIDLPAGINGFMISAPVGSTNLLQFGGYDFAQAGLGVIVVTDPLNPTTSIVVVGTTATTATVIVQAF